MNDIDVSGEDWISIGTSTNQFKGIFDGLNYRINGVQLAQNQNTFENIPVSAVFKNTIIPNDNYDYNLKVNKPKISQGMIPVRYDGTNWVVCSQDNINNEWYNYVDQASGVDGTSYWANIMIMDEFAVEGYTNSQIKDLQTQGKTNDEIIDILKGRKVTTLGSMYVWIPRYAYSITSQFATSGTGSGHIDVAFLNGIKNVTTLKVGNETKNLTDVMGQGNWIEHPAFSYTEDDSKIIMPGIWVAKFEASNGGIETGGTARPRSIPNATSWTMITAKDIYTNCLNINSSYNYRYYGISDLDSKIDPHMMKNTEWGAVAYLTQSSYGRNGNEIAVNNFYNYGYLTGKSSGITNPETVSSNSDNSYETIIGVKSSTTGNISGIYDLSGGAWEYVMGVSEEYAEENFDVVINKYIDIYEDSLTDKGIKNGDATKETSGWNSDSYYVLTDSNIYVRGGNSYWILNAGIFCSATAIGDVYDYIGFRSVIFTL